MSNDIAIIELQMKHLPFIINSYINSRYQELTPQKMNKEEWIQLQRLALREIIFHRSATVHVAVHAEDTDQIYGYIIVHNEQPDVTEFYWAYIKKNFRKAYDIFPNLLMSVNPAPIVQHAFPASYIKHKQPEWQYTPSLLRKFSQYE